MKRITPIGCLLMAIAFSAVMTAAPPAESGSLTLGSGTGGPGKETRIPLYLNLAADQQFERAAAIIDYPPVLTYTRAEVAKDAGGVLIEMKETNPPSGGKLKRIEITLKDAKGKLLPSGLIGAIFFTADKKAKQQLISLPVLEVKGFPKGSGSEVKLRGDPGSVAIYELGDAPLPSTGCFFFSH